MARFPQIVLAAAVFVLTAAAGDRVPADTAATRQKAMYVERLVSESTSARRIEESGDRTAIGRLREARALVDSAGRDLDAGNPASADEKLNEALSLVNTEVRRLSGDEVQADHAKRMYERRLNAVETFLAAYQRVSDSGQSAAAANQARALEASIAKARGKAGSGDYDGATAVLDEAYQIARGDIRAMRDGKTLVRSLDFATAEEAYDYEIGRNASYFELLRFAMSEKDPKGSMLGRIEEDRAKARSLREGAEKDAAKGDHAEALGKLEESTQILRKAIRMSGMFIPG